MLSKGLNFCPTPKSIEKFELKKDIDEFGRCIKLKCFFAKANDNRGVIRLRDLKANPIEYRRIMILCWICF